MCRRKEAHLSRPLRLAGVGTTYTDAHLIALVKHVDVLRKSMRRVKTAHPFVIDAMVIMPDHLHALWTLPEGDSDFSTRLGLINSGFSRQLKSLNNFNESGNLR